MAARASFSDDSRMIKKTLPKSLLLRDYLRDDMSSCSSNGFRSYPRRRQCCTTVRFLVEIDLNKNHKRSSIVQTKPKQSSSVLQRASALVVNAFRHFPFAAGDRISSRTPNFLPRSLSRKLFWRKTDRNNNEVKKLKSFGELIKETETTNHPSSPLKFSTAVTATTATMLTDSTSNGNSYSWSDSDFTTTTTTTTTTTSSSDVNTSQIDFMNELDEKKTTTKKRVDATAMTTTRSSTTGNEKEHHQNDQVEQFSPVSVMDFPCDNDNDVDGEDEDEDEVSSVFQRRHPNVEGTKKLIHKTRRFEGVPPLEPVKLEDRMTRLVLESTPTCHEFEQEDSQVEKKAFALLQLMKSTISHRFFKYEAVESLLLEFFEERMLEENISDYEMLQTAREWMDNQIEELFLDWESEKNRQTYARAMEKGVKWSDYGQKAEIKDIGLELEHEVFTSLVDDILLDFHE